jgi:isochorismate pyruvate lyase
VAFQRVFTGVPWEEHVGYCRALRAGDRIFVTGTVAAETDGTVHAPGDAYAQAARCLRIIRDALAELGAGPEHVTRTRMFVTDIDRWRDFGRAHAEFFGDHRPTTTMVQVSRLIHPDMLIEIEADAVAPSAGA